MPWLEPSLTLRWGPYLKLDGDEQQKIVEATIAAKKEGICTTRQAVEKVAGIFGTENVDAVLDALEKEAEDRAAKALDAAKSEQESLHALVNDDGDRTPSRRGQKEPAGAPSGGSGGASATDKSSK